MKMKCHATPGAVPPSPNAVTEVEVSDELYVLVCSPEEARIHAWDVLLGKSLRVIVGPEVMVHYLPSHHTVTLADVEYAYFVGVARANLRQIDSKP